MPCNRKYWWPHQAVAVPELEREAERPVQDPAQTRVEDALQQHVDRLARPGEAGLESHEPGLHENTRKAVTRTQTVLMGLTKSSATWAAACRGDAPAAVSKNQKKPFIMPKRATRPSILPPTMMPMR